MKQVDLTNKYAATGKLLWPKLQVRLNAMGALAVEEKGEKGPHIILQEVCESLDMLEEFQAGMKPRATEILEQLLVVLVPPLAKFILSSKELPSDVNVALVPKLAKGMELRIW